MKVHIPGYKKPKKLETCGVISKLVSSDRYFLCCDITLQAQSVSLSLPSLLYADSSNLQRQRRHRHYRHYPRRMT